MLWPALLYQSTISYLCVFDDKTTPLRGLGCSDEAMMVYTCMYWYTVVDNTDCEMLFSMVYHDFFVTITYHTLYDIMRGKAQSSPPIIPDNKYESACVSKNHDNYFYAYCH